MGYQDQLDRRGFLKLSSFLGIEHLNTFFGFLSLGTEVNPYSKDVLSAEAQNALVLKARDSIAETPEGARIAAQRLRKADNVDPNSICGPLSISQISQIVTHGTPSEEFWLAAPEGPYARPELFERTFPQIDFSQIRISDPIVLFDFNRINLQTGDFLYLFGGTRGYAHMLAITRRDSAGVLYTITNFPRADGQFIIAEVPLWDPRDKEASFVKQLGIGLGPNRRITGNAGFNLWRLKESGKSSYDQFDHSYEAEILQKQIDQLTFKSKADWRILITNVDSSEIIAESSSRVQHHPASIIKIPIALAVMKQIESEFDTQNALDFDDYLETRGFGGGTFNQLLSAMLVNSDEPATEIIQRFLESRKQNTLSLFKSWEAPHTFLTPRRTTAEDIYHFFQRIFDQNTFKYSQSRGYLLNLLSSYTGADETRLGILRRINGLKIGKIYNKRASVSQQNLLTVGDSGIVEVFTGSRSTVRHLFVYLQGAPKVNSNINYEELETELTKVVGKFAEYCLKL